MKKLKLCICVWTPLTWLRTSESTLSPKFHPATLERQPNYLEGFVTIPLFSYQSFPVQCPSTCWMFLPFLESVWFFFYEIKTIPAGTRRCYNVGIWLSFGRNVGQRRSNVVATLSFRRHFSDQIKRCYNVVFSTSNFRPDTNVIATSSFWRHFSDKNLTVYQRHYDSLFPKLCKWSFNSSFW